MANDLEWKQIYKWNPLIHMHFGLKSKGSVFGWLFFATV